MIEGETIDHYSGFVNRFFLENKDRTDYFCQMKGALCAICASYLTNSFCPLYRGKNSEFIRLKRNSYLLKKQEE